MRTYPTFRTAFKQKGELTDRAFKRQNPLQSCHVHILVLVVKNIFTVESGTRGWDRLLSSRADQPQEGGRGKGKRRRGDGDGLEAAGGRGRGIAVTTHERKFRSRREGGGRTKEGSKEWRMAQRQGERGNVENNLCLSCSFDAAATRVNGS